MNTQPNIICRVVADGDLDSLKDFLADARELFRTYDECIHVLTDTLHDGQVWLSYESANVAARNGLHNGLYSSAEQAGVGITSYHCNPTTPTASEWDELDGDYVKIPEPRDFDPDKMLLRINLMNRDGYGTHYYRSVAHMRKFWTKLGDLLQDLEPHR